jgi:predicted aspartyl protease
MQAPKGRNRTMLFAIVAAVAIAVGAGCSDVRHSASSSAPRDSAAGEIAFDWAGPGGAAVTVPVRINGRGPVDLILDTGATMTCVDTALAREWKLPEQRGFLGGAIGLGGSGPVSLLRVDSLAIGAARARGLTVCAMSLGALRSVAPEVRGLLGLNVLRNFRVTLDFERGVVRLAPPGE